ncbi:hypothetical protein ACOMHN_008006 [Nucella lapillus]
MQRANAQVKQSGIYGAGSSSQKILLDDLRCTGNETSIFFCPHSGLGSHNCGHSEDVGVFCPPSAGVPSAIMGSIEGGGSRGRLNAIVNGQRGTICDDGASNALAAVVCRQLGFNTSNAIITKVQPSAGRTSLPIVLDDVICAGNETSLDECQYKTQNNCGHDEDLGVDCQIGYNSLRVRLAGNIPNLGRVEINYNNTWGTVCRSGFSQADAAVICEQLGLNGSLAVIAGTAVTGPGTGTIWLSDLQCTGSEANIASCRHSGYGIHSCDHGQDAGVYCPASAEASADVLQVRLVGPLPDRGRLEVKFFNQSWGTVCDNSFGTQDAAVVCKMLGLPTSQAMAVGTTVFGQGTGPILLTNLQCSGSESSIAFCSHAGYGIHACSHGEDVGVFCPASAEASADVLQVRLVGPLPDRGRLEVKFLSQSWGTVCDDGFGTKDAAVVCRMLGLPTANAQVKQSGIYGAGSSSQKILLDDLRCTGNETSIFFCLHSGLGSHNCGHSEDVGVFCPPSAGTTRPPVIWTRPVPGAIVGSIEGGGSRGRLNAIVNGQRGTVCDDGASNALAAVVCRQLGFNTSNAIITKVPPSAGRTSLPIVLDDVICAGNETSLDECQHETQHNCGHNEDLGIDCQIGYNSLRVRLAGNIPNLGRVEINYNNTWGTVCRQDFSQADTAVICEQLGFNGSLAVIAGTAVTGPGTGTIWLSDLQCTGSEANIASCRHNGYGINSCDHGQDAGVFCPASAEASADVLQVRLVGPLPDRGRLEVKFFNQSWASAEASADVLQVRLVGPSPERGRLEVKVFNQSWGTVCDDGFDTQDAAVVCRMLGFPTGNAQVKQSGSYGAGSSSQKIVLDDLRCTGNENSIFFCPHSGLGSHNCGHSEDVGVFCPPSAGVPGAIVDSIEGGGSRGRLNAIVNGQRGTVCDDGASNALAAVVCRQLGFNTSNAIITKVPPSAGRTSLPIVLANVICAGNETSLDECQYEAQHNCGHDEDLGVDCQIGYNSLRVRLAGNIPNLGRVEINYNNTWGTVCRSGFSQADAAVICEQLGLNGSLAVIAGTAVTGPGTGTIWLSDLQCTGSEANIASCRHSGYGIHSCDHGQDAGVYCPASAEASADALQVRLVGPLPDRGRLEVKVFNQSWGTVCDNSFDTQDAAVVCRMLGLPTAEASADVLHVRLVGPLPDRGRLEVKYFNQSWGTVCDDGFDTQDAAVVCRMLGLPTANAQVKQSGIYGAGSSSQKILLDDLRCTGNETSIFFCPHSGLGSHNCGHSEDVGVFCPPSAGETTGLPVIWTRPVPGAIMGSIEGGGSRGRLNAIVNGQRGTVCDDGASNALAALVCRQLGFNTSNAIITKVQPSAGRTSLPIVLDDVICAGNETSLDECQYETQHNCGHDEDLGVDCQIGYNSLRVRLAGNIPNLGRVEINYNNTWGTVCRSGFSQADAAVICEQLGLNGSLAVIAGTAVTGPGTGTIWLSDLQCTGSEANIASCRHSGYGIHSCNHGQDAGVYCPASAEASADVLQVRLVGPLPDRGRLEVKVVNQSWGTVCDDGFDTQDAAVVCKMLGLPTAEASADVLQVRLVGPLPDRGRLEVKYFNQSWGTVCDDGFDTQDAAVVCRLLGLPTGNAQVKQSGIYGAGSSSQNILLDDLRCTGNETSILLCPHSGLGSHDCSHSEDVGVFCPPSAGGTTDGGEARTSAGTTEGGEARTSAGTTEGGEARTSAGPTEGGEARTSAVTAESPADDKSAPVWAIIVGVVAAIAVLAVVVVIVVALVVYIHRRRSGYTQGDFSEIPLVEGPRNGVTLMNTSKQLNRALLRYHQHPRRWLNFGRPCLLALLFPPVEKWIQKSPSCVVVTVGMAGALPPVQLWATLPPVQMWVVLPPVQLWVTLPPAHLWVILLPVWLRVDLPPAQLWVALLPVQLWMALLPAQLWMTLLPVQLFVALSPVQLLGPLPCVCWAEEGSRPSYNVLTGQQCLNTTIHTATGQHWTPVPQHHHSHSHRPALDTCASTPPFTQPPASTGHQCLNTTIHTATGQHWTPVPQHHHSHSHRPALDTCASTPPFTQPPASMDTSASTPPFTQPPASTGHQCLNTTIHTATGQHWTPVPQHHHSHSHRPALDTSTSTPPFTQPLDTMRPHSHSHWTPRPLIHTATGHHAPSFTQPLDTTPPHSHSHWPTILLQSITGWVASLPPPHSLLQLNLSQQSLLQLFPSVARFTAAEAIYSKIYCN